VPAGRVRKPPAAAPSRDGSAARDDAPGVPELLDAAVAAIGGARRPGQDAMAEAVRRAIETGEHLAVQAGTGTGKSLAYLVPAVRHAIGAGATVVVSTATIALQRQLIDRDLPRLAAAIEPLLGRAPVFAILKGRRNYACLHRLETGPPADAAETLFDIGAPSIAADLERLHAWAAGTQTGDRDDLVPGVPERAWRQVSVSSRECIGAHRCPFAGQCYAERARDLAAEADIVVTNHALLAIDALGDFQVLPEHDLVIVDEAHDLVDRVTAAASAELSAAAVEAAARRCSRLVTDEVTDRLRRAGEAAAPILTDTAAGRIDHLAEPLGYSLAAIRDAASGCAAGILGTDADSGEDPERLAAGRSALASLEELSGTADRILCAFGPAIPDREDVVWMEQPRAAQARFPPTLRVAPLEVAGLLAERLFGRRTVVLTSATLALGGSFEPLAAQWGLPPPATAGPAAAGAEDGAEAGTEAGTGTVPLAWSGVDVGSPFDHARSAILYVAKHLPPPGRDGLSQAYLTELAELIAAAGGRTLGLFSSMRAATQAAAELRGQIGHPLLCQGDAPTSQLVTQFAADEETCLFGTLSLWQGVDVPGRSLQLVVIDRIPFPRPDDPLASARQRAVSARGGNGFMSVAAAHAALLLAQGTGRLLRTMSDRGVVAILDPRLETARYRDFLRASLPAFWTTTDPDVVRGALRRLGSLPGPVP
jgi:ATP-dependent DNA helicase DinG